MKLYAALVAQVNAPKGDGRRRKQWDVVADGDRTPDHSLAAEDSVAGMRHVIDGTTEARSGSCLDYEGRAPMVTGRCIFPLVQWTCRSVAAWCSMHGSLGTERA
jgi:hypothetical protein